MRPRRLVVVVGTGTGVGKTWVSARVLTTLRAAGVTVAARKPAQSFDAGDDPSGLDATVLGAATGEEPETVCPPHRWYEVAMAPPMAADVLGRERITMSGIIEELAWPAQGIDVGLVESAGGVRSPLTHDGDVLALVAALAPDLVILVADAGLGTINAVRLSVGALTQGGTAEAEAGTAEATAEATGVVVALNRFDEGNDLHRRNRAWLREHDGMTVVALPGQDADLVTMVGWPAAVSHP